MICRLTFPNAMSMPAGFGRGSCISSAQVRGANRADTRPALDRDGDGVACPAAGRTGAVAVVRFLGVDLAWRQDEPERLANESGVAAVDPSGRVLDAGWTRGLDETVEWVRSAAGPDSALLFVDAPLVVENVAGQRLCETQVGQRYGRWKVSANTTNVGSPRLAGVALRVRLEAAGWVCSDGLAGPPADGQTFAECYPYTTLVGAPELGYAAERPRYKRKPRMLRMAQWRPERAASCDELVGRLAALSNADPPLRVDSHPATRLLQLEQSPLDDVPYKHREDLIDALLCAWTAALWARHGLARCQVLGEAASVPGRPAATIIAPARPEQRR
jgi:predicted RNase H-like nuclease